MKNKRRPDLSKKQSKRSRRVFLSTVNRTGGDMVIKTRTPSGRVSGIVLTSGRTRLEYTAAHQIGHYIRARLLPINIPPVKIYDGAGRLIAQVVTNPVTGSKHRIPVEPNST